MKRHTTMLMTLLLLACLALPGAAAGQEGDGKPSPSPAQPVPGEFIFHVTVHEHFATDKCFVAPLFFRHPDGSLSSVHDVLDKLRPNEATRLYTQGKTFHYRNWRGEEHSCRDIKLGTVSIETDEESNSDAEYWIGEARCTGSSILDPRGDTSLLLPAGMELHENPAILSGPTLEELLDRSRAVAEAHFSGIYARYGRAPTTPIQAGLILVSQMCGDLDGDGLRDCAMSWRDDSEAPDGKHGRPDCDGVARVVVVAFGNGRTETYLQDCMDMPECASLFTSGILPMPDGSRALVVYSSYTSGPADIVDFNPHPPRRVARFFK